MVITEDSSGRLYVGGGRGLDRLDPSTGLVKHFTTADGLAPGSFRSAFRDRDGVLWFGMTSGISRLSPPAERRPASAARVDQRRVDRGVPQLVSALGEREMALSDLAHRSEPAADRLHRFRLQLRRRASSISTACRSRMPIGAR